ncbi:hypothetical protein [Amaricoccus solimangrovi]|uniref:Uncharacterized protein n=1 Tax=Amaricoccus solimangrovi TaxID=2589815 RepID=A0A501WQY6_9RHOB|nr:hypothetical protein [Amaricoccus solimangrovi]TPE50755.1 hypothetical protein FJM51_10880 [Amaricoccus solimangrovi]
MKRTANKLVAMGLLLAAPLVTVACAAPPTDVSAIEKEVQTDLAQIGINGVDTSTLTVKQLQEIKLIAGQQTDRQSKQNQINALLGRAPGSQAG